MVRVPRGHLSIYTTLGTKDLTLNGGLPVKIKGLAKIGPPLKLLELLILIPDKVNGGNLGCGTIQRP